VQTYDSLSGVSWQGRYGLPFLVGLVVLAAYALDRAGRSLPGPWPALAGLLYVGAQVVGEVDTLHIEIGRSPLVHSSAWVRPPMWLVVLACAVGAGLVWWSVVRGKTGHFSADAEPVDESWSEIERVGPRP
jgi:hypothetical protein